ncbi:tRNA G18 (ribose-2'-O)-methylase SpoU [Cryobacterium mesophilum]|uniref:TrmH family RNA methyltransferase n=1 Tax=Terrimesophilobacter mesophilus TaxID=433647 RepID=UPI0017EA2BE8|nr:RNA methyltransferase [Terrimesophilobacter mesophilus]MBB5631964.1 tRNA G18 (ribose-2'-O)-methylase SpoU [Terrimesophilobacter mesophilus]
MPRIIRISDPHDPLLRDYRDLTDVALRRVTEPAEGLYLAESSKVIARAIEAGHRPRSVLLLEKWLDALVPILSGPGVADLDIPIYVGSSETLESTTGFSMHRGALASMMRPPLPQVSDLIAAARRIVVIEDVVDHTNVGAIFRTAAALGADAVLVTPRCADPLYRRSVRVSMGAVLQVPWTRLPEWPEGADVLHGAGFTIAALALEDAVDLADFASAAPERIALLLGTEGDGLSRNALRAADVTVRIPMSGGIDSLNVAAASAVALWALR